MPLSSYCGAERGDRESGVSNWSLKALFGLLSHEADRVM